MTETSVSRIIGIVQDIKHFENSIQKTQGADPMSELMRFQFQHSKEQLVRELMIELVRSGIDFHEIEDLMARLMTFLSHKVGQGEKPSPVVMSSLREVERLVAIT